MDTYRDENGNFDLQSALDDYRKFLQNVPKKCRIYLEQSVNAVGYEMRESTMSSFGYSNLEDKVLYNPRYHSFYDHKFTVANTHELAHRIDKFFVKSYENEAFTRAIENSRDILEANIEKYQNFCNKNFNNGFLSDIFSAICEDDYVFPANHSKSYWQEGHKKADEIFANLFSLEAFRDVNSLKFFKNNFSELFEAYNNLEYLI